MLGLSRFIELILFPPGNVLVLGVIGLLLLRYRPVWGRRVLGLSFIMLWCFSTPLLSFALLNSLQSRYPVLNQVPQDADAIVVLGGGREYGDNEYGRQDDLTLHASARVRYAAYLAKQTELPVVFTGGQVWNRPGTEAELARQVFLAEHGLDRVLVEGQSKTTRENARYTAELLKAQGWKRPLIVTEAWHMPRAMYSFEQAGVNAVAAPTARDTPSPIETGWWAITPRAPSLERSRIALHEWLGLLWYARSD